MNLSDFSLSLEQCKISFNYWKKFFSYEDEIPDEIVNCARILPTTHTFPSVRVWKIPENNNNETLSANNWFRYPYKDIFFEDNALMSDGLRKQQGKLNPFEQRRDMSRARELKLNWFVFTLMGFHDPYYGGLSNKGWQAKPFGVFISTTKEGFPESHISRRDIDEMNPEVKVDKLSDAFNYCMTPEQGRNLLPHEIMSDSRFEGDFFEYWGKPEQWDDETKRHCHWQWKYEMRFFRTIPMNYIEAVLWPTYNIMSTAKKTLELNGIEEIQKFKKLYPKINVIDYPWVQDDNGKGLVNASCLTASFYAEKKRFPESWIEVEQGIT